MKRYSVIRNIVLSAFCAAFAAGGYFMGYAKTAGQETSVPAPDFDKVSPNLWVILAADNATDLELTQQQIQKVKKIEKDLLPKYKQARREAWNKELLYWEKEARGEVIASEFAFISVDDPGVVNSLRAEVHNVVEEMYSRLRGFLSPQQMKDLLGKYKTPHFTEYPVAYQLIRDPNVQASIGLTQRQKNQFVAMDELIESRRARIVIQARNDPRWQFEQYAELLTPLQRLHLNTILYDKIYVER